ncbi:MAG: M20 family metallopeptidase [Alphaproteobacteria bacterium]|nr:M20 family metallopeptidase [Alphaproteobacteria bacterium]
MSRQAAIASATAYFDRGDFVADLARRVAIPTESQDPARAAELGRYLEAEMRPAFEGLGFTCRVLENPKGGGPLLLATHHEAKDLPTVLSYGHGDVIRGQDKSWRAGLAPWLLVQEGDRLYGRGTADNKGQHSINLGALAAVRAARGGRLGFNAAFLLEMGEEVGSPGLREVIEAHRRDLAADLLIASDGPRISAERPTLFMGARGALNFDLTVELRKGAHHSGNWGGLLANPGTLLAHAIATLVGPRGQILLPELKPARLSNSVRDALADVAVDGGQGGPLIDTWWGEPGLTPAEKVYGWNTLEILAYKTGDPEKPVNAIPGHASAHCQIRFTVDTDPEAFLPAIDRKLKASGLGQVKVKRSREGYFPATRLDPRHPVAQWAAQSLERSSGRKPGVLPNLGGSLPNDLFADLLGLPTIWVPHSYPSCSQHAPDEHLLASVAREALGLMAGLFWDLGEGTLPRDGGV